MEAKQLLMACIRNESSKVSPQPHYPSMPTYLKGVSASSDEEKFMQVSEGKALFLVTGIKCSACSGSVEKAVKRLPGLQGSAAKALFSVTGMTCSACGCSVKKAVECLPQTEEAVVDFLSHREQSMVNLKSIMELPDDVILSIGKKIPVDLCAHFQTVNSDWCRALELIVGPERVSMNDPARLAAHREMVQKQRKFAKLIADSMNDNETYGDALIAGFNMESNDSIVPFHLAGIVLEKLRKNKNIKHKCREYFLKLYQNPVWRA